MFKWFFGLFSVFSFFAEGLDLSSCSAFVAYSNHFILEEEYNEKHWHIKCKKEPVLIGAYYNSEKNVSVYVGEKKLRDKIEWEYGLVTGYKVFPVIPYGRVKIKEIFIIPAIEQTNRGDWNFGLVIGVEKKIW